jgi:ribonuclease P protein component
LKRSFRLTRNEDIKSVRQEGITIAEEAIVLGFKSNDLERNRIAVIAGRSIGGAVQRNLAKRRMRSAFQCFQPMLVEGYDIVIIARKHILEIEYQALVDALRSLLEKAGLLKENVR